MLYYLLLWECNLEAAVASEINDRVSAIITYSALVCGLSRTLPSFFLLYMETVRLPTQSTVDSGGGP